MKNPLVSIITPSLNQGNYIKETIESVISQDYPEIEHIVVDGGSTDATVGILSRFGEQIRWVSEPDQGQADAINKGFGMAHGKILGWLNSDDIYLQGAVRKIVDRFLSNPDLVMVYGDAHFIDDEGSVVGDYPTEPFVYKRLADTCFICQPTVFFKAGVLKAVGMLDTSLHLCLDYDYWIRIGKRYGPSRISYLRGGYLANSRMYKENKTLHFRQRLYDEVMPTLQRHFGYVSDNWIGCYINEIILGNGITYGNLREEKSAGAVRKSFLILYYMTKLFGKKRGLLYFWRQVLNLVRKLSGVSAWLGRGKSSLRT